MYVMHTRRMYNDLSEWGGNQGEQTGHSNHREMPISLVYPFISFNNLKHCVTHTTPLEDVGGTLCFISIPRNGDELAPGSNRPDSRP